MSTIFEFIEGLYNRHATTRLLDTSVHRSSKRGGWLFSKRVRDPSHSCITCLRKQSNCNPALGPPRYSSIVHHKPKREVLRKALIFREAKLCYRDFRSRRDSDMSRNLQRYIRMRDSETSVSFRVTPSGTRRLEWNDMDFACLAEDRRVSLPGFQSIT